MTESIDSIRIRGGRLIDSEATAKMRADKLSAWFGDKRALREISLPLI